MLKNALFLLKNSKNRRVLGAPPPTLRIRPSRRILAPDRYYVTEKCHQINVTRVFHFGPLPIKISCSACVYICFITNFCYKKKIFSKVLC